MASVDHLVFLEPINQSIVIEFHHLKAVFTLSGSYEESEEMFPQWFCTNQMPFNEMLVDVKEWFELFLKKISFVAHFKLDGGVILDKKFKLELAGERLQPLQI